MYLWRVVGPLQLCTFGWDLFQTRSVGWAWFDLFFALNAMVISIDAYVRAT